MELPRDDIQAICDFLVLVNEQLLAMDVNAALTNVNKALTLAQAINEKAKRILEVLTNDKET